MGWIHLWMLVGGLSMGVVFYWFIVWFVKRIASFTWDVSTSGPAFVFAATHASANVSIALWKSIFEGRTEYSSVFFERTAEEERSRPCRCGAGALSHVGKSRKSARRDHAKRHATSSTSNCCTAHWSRVRARLIRSARITYKLYPQLGRRYNSCDEIKVTELREQTPYRRPEISRYLHPSPSQPPRYDKPLKIHPRKKDATRDDTNLHFGGSSRGPDQSRAGPGSYAATPTQTPPKCPPRPARGPGKNPSPSV